ncbi:hypothetical protein [Salinibius halmophilus]|uniref:hypothetical protein n=1 Tax=Salinibius halmophilus TaxID=1853216 RepID=UPI000E66915D|nr:hypothetical protein [Salinibius halmophilus]
MTLYKCVLLFKLALITCAAFYAVIYASSWLWGGGSEFMPIPSLPLAMVNWVVPSLIAVGWFWFVVRKPWYKRHKLKIGLLAYVVICALGLWIIASGLYLQGWAIFPVLVFITSMLLRNSLYLFRFSQHKKARRR